MRPWLHSNLLRDVRARFERLYGSAADRCVERFALLLGRYGVGSPKPAERRPWTERDAVLIAYGDMVTAPAEKPLQTLRRFTEARLGDALSTVHVLPFFPSSSDDGFSVVHFRHVDPALGAWEDIHSLAGRYRVMADLILNHVSRQSNWFGDFEMGVAPGCRYILTADPGTDVANVVRPRTHPLLTPVQTRGGLRHVWTTFSDDQIDLDYGQPDVLFEMLDILLFYIAQGVRVIRLDAVAYLWKRIGTRCIHLPEAHEVVKLMRELLDLVAPDVWIITETNVPHDENVAYFGRGDEAHLVYQFSLPPLVLHALGRGDASALTRWATALAPPPPGCTFLNFTASHDGIGLRPLEGLVAPADIAKLAEHAAARGGAVSMRSDAQGERPYELNISWYDAMGSVEPERPDMHLRRFLCSQAIPLALPGIPAVYFNSFVAAPNDLPGMARTGRVRSINRRKWTLTELESKLADTEATAARSLAEISRMLRVRSSCTAFHPDAPCRVLDWGPDLFAVQRGGSSTCPSVIAVSNCTRREVALPPAAAGPGAVDLLADGAPVVDRPLAPYQTAWVAMLGKE